jgi:hypothetical protein|mmetsp:Transcript_29657/g.54309  ORF Transcript_29657/g.54309 Transcript_29657/m.54309 type:complete len:301 (-) Transcript_29657:254-1156(-)
MNNLLRNVLVGVILMSRSSFLPVCHAASDEVEVVLKDKESLLVGTLEFNNGKCAITLQKDGALKTRRKSDLYGNIEFRQVWSTGALGDEGDYTATLDDGTLKIQIGNEDPVYSTVRASDDFEAAGKEPYRLVIDDDCALSILGEVTDSYDGYSYDVRIWTSVRTWMTNGDVMQKGDIMTGFHYMQSCASSGNQYSYTVPMHTMVTQDCNIIQRTGRDPADFENGGGDVVWKAEIDDDDALPESKNCYVYVDKDFVGAFEGNFIESERDIQHPQRTGRYWRTTKGNWEETQVSDDQGFYQD